MAGRLEATFAPGARGVHARTSRSAALELRGPFEGGSPPRYVLRNVTAGVFGGDTYEVSLHVRSGARLAVAPTAASKVYGARGGTVRSHLRLEVEAGGLLDYDAGAAILQRGSQLEQTVEVVVDRGTAVAYREIVVLGRLARGERLEFARYTSTLRIVTTEGASLYEERCDLRPAEDAAVIDTAVGGAGVIGTLILAGAEDDAPVLRDDVGRVYAGTSVLPNGAGVLVRALAPRLEAVEQLFASLTAAWASPATRAAIAAAQAVSER